MAREQSFEPGSGPQFCPGCGKDGPIGEALCATCGDSLRPKGYCPICEGWVRASPGEACPKHDVELLVSPEPIELSGSRRLVTLATYGLPVESYGPKIRLEAEGIPVFLDGERMGQNAIYQVATGGVKLQVPEEFAADARILLAQNWSPVKDDDDDEEGDSLDPEPGRNRRSVMKLMILVYLFGPLALILIGLLIASLSRG